MPIIRSEKFAGKQVWLGDGLVAFDDDGMAVGVINRGGTPITPPAPLYRLSASWALHGVLSRANSIPNGFGNEKRRHTSYDASFV